MPHRFKRFIDKARCIVLRKNRYMLGFGEFVNGQAAPDEWVSAARDTDIRLIANQLRVDSFNHEARLGKEPYGEIEFPCS
jgi:hypothetical protein